jgi:cell division protein FtsB
MTEIDDRLDRLESQLDRQQQRIDDQQATIEDQQATIESQQATIEEQREQIADLKDDGGTTATDSESTVLNRRNALKAGGILALLFGSAGTASADSQGQVGTASDPLQVLYTEEINGGVTGEQVLTDLLGNGLALSSGSLGLATPFSDLTTLVGSPVTAGGAIQSSSGTALTLNTDGGTQALKLGVLSSDGAQTAGGNVIAGHPNNTVNSSAVGVVIGGGGKSNGSENTVGGDYATVGGGESNTANGSQSTVGGGENNMASGLFATVGGGKDNNTTSDAGGATVGGGKDNTASSSFATVSGGEDNTASGNYATVPGGFANTASALDSLACGRAAGATDDNAFVWNDGSGASTSDGDGDDQFTSSTNAVATPSGANTFSVKATSGVRFITSANNSSHAYVDTSGNVKASGTKDFVETVNTPTGERTIAYTALEAPTVRTEVSGVATVADGYAEIDLPDHFAWVTDSDEQLVVQVTPHATEAVAPQVTERSTDRILIEDPRDGPDAYEVSYTIKGTREGYADKTVVSDPSEGDGDAESGSGEDAARVAMQPDDEPARDDADKSGGNSRADPDNRRRNDDTDALRQDNEELRAENDRLREQNAELESRLERIERELGIDTGERAADD